MPGTYKPSFCQKHSPIKRFWLALFLTMILAGCSRPPETVPARPVYTSPSPPIPTAITIITPSARATPTSPIFLDLPASQPHPILGDVRVRQGIALCIDRQSLLSAVYPWLPEASNYEMDSIVPRTHWAHPSNEPGFRDSSFDPEAGIALLEQAGWELPPDSQIRRNAAGDELRLDLETTDTSFRRAWTERFVQQMKSCGAEIKPAYRAAEEFFAEDGILQQRRFDLAAYSEVIQSFPEASLPFSCEDIPLAEAGWQGMIYSSWCSPETRHAFDLASASPWREVRRQAYRDLQILYSWYLPFLPLFNRLDFGAANPALDNFAPDPTELYTWNAAHWDLPGKDSLVIGLSAEPVSLSPLETSYVSQLIQALVYGLDYTQLNYDFQPVTLSEFPTLENGKAVKKPVTVAEGNALVDADNNAVTLQPGVQYRDAVGNLKIFNSEPIETGQLTVEYRFRDDLVWSDGVPVRRQDYELAYRILCDPRSGADEYLAPPAFCDKVESVAFTDDTSYVVTWKPGYSDPTYFLPPIARLPAHQVISDGRRLGDVHPAEWTSLPEVMQAPLGIGPYRVKSWEYGKEIVLEANPNYHQPPPELSEIVIKFVPIDAGIQPATRISRGEIDLIGWDSLLIFPDSLDALLAAQSAGKVWLYPTPSRFYERIDFKLYEEVTP